MHPTNPYEAPGEPLPANDGVVEKTTALLRIPEALVLIASIASSGAVFGAGLVVSVASSVRPLIFGTVAGFLMALIPAIVCVLLCSYALPQVVKFVDERTKIVAIGSTSGSLAGFFSTALLLLIDGDVDLVSAVILSVATALGGLGGLVGTFVVHRYLRTTNARTRPSKPVGH